MTSPPTPTVPGAVAASGTAAPAVAETAVHADRDVRPARVSRRRRLPGPGTALAWALLLLCLLAAAVPGLLTGHDPNEVDPVNALAGPGAEHWMGTDQLGRDVLSRVIHGARISLLIGFGAIALAAGAGTLLGALAATAGRAVDQVVMRITDVLLAFPGLMLALVVVAVLGPGRGNAALAIGISLMPGFIRMARGRTLAIRDSDYVRAAVVLGRSRRSILLRHLLPNALPPLVLLATVNTGSAIIAGSTLSFLGMGPQPPSPEWGAMLAEGRDYLEIAWASAVFPGVAVTATVIAVTVVGRDLQRRLDGRDGHGRA